MTSDLGARRRILLVPRIRLARILWRILPHLATALLAASIPRLLGATEGIRRQALVAGLAFLAYGLARSLLMEVLSPTRPALRILPLRDAKARSLAAGLRLFLFLLFVSEIGRWLVTENAWRPSVVAALGVLESALFVIGIAALVASTGLFAWLRNRQGHRFWGLIGRFAGRLLVPLLILAGLLLVVVEGLGYVPLAHFVASNLVATGVQLVVAVIAYHYLRAALVNSIGYLRGDEAPAGVASAAAGGELQPDPVLLGLERILEVALRILVVLGAVAWVLAGWEIGPSDVAHALSTPLFGISGWPTWGRVGGGSCRSCSRSRPAGWCVRP